MSKTVNFIAAGDLAFADIEDKVDEKYANYVLEDIQNVLDSADIKLINLENPLTNCKTQISKTGPCLKGLPKNVEFLKAGRFDAAILANNHTGDYGIQGIKDTINILKKSSILYVGAGLNIDEAYKPLLIEKNGLKLCIIASAENEFGCATQSLPGMAGFELGRITEAIKSAKEISDYIIVIFHGGNEYNPLPSPKVKERYHLFVDLGADAVIGMHTHCQQGYEYYKKCPIVYSTGNFWFRSHSNDSSVPWYYGYLPKLTFQSGETTKLEIIPYHLTANFKKINVLTDNNKKLMCDYIDKISAVITNDNLLKDYFKGWCMISGPGYAKNLNFDDKLFNDRTIGKTEKFNYLLNDFRCEAHNELMTELLKIIYNNEYDFAFKMAKKITKLQKMPDLEEL